MLCAMMETGSPAIKSLTIMAPLCSSKSLKKDLEFLAFPDL